MDDETQALINAYKRPDGAMDWYRVFDLPRTATREQIRDAFAILSATFDPKTGMRNKKDTVRYVLLQRGFAELDDPARRKKYDAFLRFEHDHARLLVAIEGEQQKQQIALANTWLPPRISLFLHRGLNTRFKRVALLLLPFFIVVDMFLLVRDLDPYSWEPSLSFALFLLMTVACLLLVFTKLGDWIRNG